MTTSAPDRTYPLTPLQQGMLFHSRLAPRAGVYVQQLLVTLPEAIDADALRRAWQFIANRHAVLHTAFPADTDGDSLQVVDDEAEVPFAAHDWSDVPAVEYDQRLRDFLDDDRERGVNPALAPLTRLALIRRSEADYRLVWTFHHALLDGRSHRLVLEEAFTAYEAFRDELYPSLLPTRPFVEHVEWLRAQDEAAAERYWHELLRGFHTPTPLPTTRSVSITDEPEIAETETRLGPETLATLSAFAEGHGLTLTTLLHGAWAVLLARYTGENDIVFGTTRSGRRPDIERGGQTVGLLVNTLPLRARVDPDQPLVDWLKELRAQWVAGRPVDYAAPVRVQEWSEVPHGSSLYETLLVVENYQLDETLHARGGLWAARSVTLLERPHYPLTVAASAGRDLLLKLHYDRRRFDDATASRLLAHLAALLSNIPAHAIGPVRDLPMLSPAEYRQVVFDWNATAASYPRDRCLDQLFEEQADRTPDAVAVQHEGRAWTYRELDERANRLAHHLRGLGAGPGSLVAVCMNRSAEMIVAVLGILKAGAAYVPLDPAYPKERLSFLLRDTGAAVLVTQVRRLERLPQIAIPVVCLDADWPTVALLPAGRPERRTTAEDRAYIIYTSGSTGTPKGVVLRHQAVVNTLAWVNKTFAIGPGDRVLWVTSICFDLSVYDIFGVLAAGGSVRVATGSELRDPERLLDILRDEPITFWDSAPALLALLAPHFAKVRDRAAPSRLRLVFLSGDWIPVPLPDQVRSTFPGAQVISLGGATEAAIWSNFYPVGAVDPSWPSIPYGRPIQNARYYLLDNHGQPAPVGVPAELFIAGDCVADGYHNRPELTAERFVPEPFPIADCGLRIAVSEDQSAIPRMYRTGDRAVYWPDGTIEFLGRIDNQIKVRGYRIEPGEVEAALVKHPGVREVVAAAVADAGGEKQLIAYVVSRPGREPSAADLRRFLQERLPDFLVPSHYVLLASLPLNANGKVDRKALPAPDRGQPAAGSIPPRDATETALAEVWCEVLGLERVGIFDNFFELGGHSLKAARVVSRVRQRLGRELPLADFFRSPTIAGSVCALENAATGAVAAVDAGSARAAAGPAQRQMWFLHQLGQGSDVYTIAYSFHIAGDIDADALRAALAALSERHAALRTTFTDERGSLEQVIATSGPVELPCTDLSQQPPAERDAELQRLTDEHARSPFDLRRGPLWRVYLVRLSEHDHRLLLALHHLIADGQSLVVLTRELAALYTAAREGTPADLPPAGSFAEDCRRLESDLARRLPELVEYWKGYLTPLPEPLALPGARPRLKAANYRGAVAPMDLPPDTAAAVAALARSAGVTPFAVLLAAFQATLARVSGQADFAVGTPVGCRTRPGAEELVGPLINTLVLRADLSGDPTFTELIGRTSRAARGALAHQELPFDVLVGELRPQRATGHQPLFQVLFSYAPGLPPLTVPGAKWTAETVHTGTAKFDLSLYLDDGPAGLTGHVEYGTDVFDRATVERLAGHLRTLLAGALADPEARVSALPLLSDEEQRRILVEWNATAKDRPGDCTHRLVAEQAARTAGRPAVRYDGRTIIYRELDRRSNQLAHHLRGLGVGPDVPVGLYLERSAEWVIAALAVWKAGGAYLPLDPHYPDERLAFYLRDARAPVLITQGDFANRLPPTEATVVRLDAEAAAIARQPATEPETTVGSDHLAYILYTSGSTGTPKGVMVTHGGVSNLLQSLTRTPGFDEHDRFLAITTPAFDIHVLELWLPLILGASVEVMAPDVAADGRALARSLRQMKPTVLQATPATWRLLLAAGWTGDRGLKAISGGEALAPDLAGALLSRVGELWNGYGPTETTVYSTGQRIWTATAPIPIGKPLDNTRVYVLDRHRQPVPVGTVGDLYIGGAGVARGYLNRPELTAERFVIADFSGQSAILYRTGDLARWRSDGVLDYLGRTDDQVKVRGFRIELGEVEAALAQHPGVLAATVTARRDGTGADSLAAYVVPRGKESPPADELRRLLRTTLPEYMVPTHFRALPELPRTPNGKVDRKALPAPEAIAPPAREIVPPRNDIERDLAAIWAEVLNVRPVGVTDDFFEVGGHSYLAAVLLTRVQERLGHSLPLGALFAAPTVEKLAAVLQRKLEVETDGSLVPLRSDGGRPPLFLIAGVGGHVFTFHKFARLLGPDQPAYGVKAIGVDGSAPPADRIEAIAARYAAEIAAERPDGPVVLGGYSIGALVAFELALQLQALGRPVGPLVVFDMMAPGYPKRLPLPRRVLIHLANLARGRGPGRGVYLRDRLASVRRRVLRRLGLGTWAVPEVEGVAGLPPAALRRVWAGLLQAKLRYRPCRQFRGSVLLFQAKVQETWEATVLDDPLYGWAKWATDGVERHTVPGGHLDMFREGNLTRWRSSSANGSTR